MAEKQDIIFRRIRGRIVPIRRNKTNVAKGRRDASRVKRAEQARAAGFIGAGLGASIAGGLLAGGALKRGVRSKQMAFKFGRGAAGISAQEGLMPGAQAFKKGARNIRFGRKSAFAAQLFGGALIGRGITKITGSEGEAAQISSTVAGEVAAFGVGAGIKKAARGKPLRASAQQGFQKVARFVLRKKFKLNF